MLTQLFVKNFSFSDSTEIEFGFPVRKFNSFNHAAEEASIRRFYGGPSLYSSYYRGNEIREYFISIINCLFRPLLIQV